MQITANLPAGGRLPVRGLLNGCNVVEAGLLGGVADPDVDALLRSSQPSRKRCETNTARVESVQCACMRERERAGESKRYRNLPLTCGGRHCEHTRVLFGLSTPHPAPTHCLAITLATSLGVVWDIKARQARANLREGDSIIFHPTPDEAGTRAHPPPYYSVSEGLLLIYGLPMCRRCLSTSPPLAVHIPVYSSTWGSYLSPYS